MDIMQKRARIAVLFASLLAGCTTHPISRPAQLRPDPVAATFVFRNQSRDRIAVYLVEDTRESLLGRLEPLQSASLPLPDRVLTTRGTVRLAIIANGHTSLQPSRETGALISLRRPGSSLIGQSWAYTAGQLSEP